MDHGNDQPVVDGHGEADVDVGLRHDPAVLPGRVHAGMLSDGGGDQLHQEVGIGDADAGALDRALPPGDESGRVDLAYQVELGRGRPALGHALDHDPPDGAHARSAGGRRRGDPGRGGRGSRGPRRGGEDVGRQDGAAGPGAAQRAHVQAALGGEPARLRATPAARRGAGPLPGCPASRRSTKARTSAFSIRRPLAVTWARSTPCCSATFRARGDAFGRRRGGDRRRHRGSRSGPRADRRRWRRGLDGSGLVGREDERDRLADGDDVALPARSPRPGRRRPAPRSRRWPCRSRSRGAGRPSATVSPGARSHCRTLPESCASSSAGMMTRAGIRRSLQSARAASKTRLLRRHRQVLQDRRERHRHVHGAHALDRRVEVVEGPVRDHRGDLGGDAVALVALVHHEGARGLLGRRRSASPCRAARSCAGRSPRR